MNTRPVRNFSDPVCQPFDMEGDGHGVLLLHGFTGSAAHMRLLGEGLHARGFTVEAINLPGHAQTMDAMAATGWQDWLDAAKEAFLKLQSRKSPRRISTPSIFPSFPSLFRTRHLSQSR